MTKADYVIIGAGIVGLATARELKHRLPYAKILIVEKESSPGRHQTGRNSGVIHAGVYYKPGSLKARLCRAGVDRTINFCEKENIAYEQCGKLIVATDDTEVSRLDELEKRASKNNLTLCRLTSSQLRDVEPNIAGVSALHVRETGIVDYGAICEKVSAHLLEDDVSILFEEETTAISERADEIVIETSKSEISASKLIACAGLQADRIARMSGLEDDFRIIPFRGEYFRLPAKFDQVSDHLIYPVPDPAYPFLGVHLTKMIGGYTTVGPNAVLSFGRENYDRNRPVGRDAIDLFGFPGLWRFLAKNMHAGVHELTGSAFRKLYLERCRRYCPELRVEDLQPYPTGIRAQAVWRSGEFIDDFLIKQTDRTLHVCNAPSPAATSAFPIAEEIVNRMLQ